MALFREFRDRFNEVERAHMQPVIDAYTRVCDNRLKGKDQRDRPVVAWEPDKPVCSVCDRAFTNIRRRHHCRLCGRNCCDDDAPNRTFRLLLGASAGAGAGAGAAAGGGEGSGAVQCRACVSCTAALARYERTVAITRARALVAQSGLTQQFTMLSQARCLTAPIDPPPLPRSPSHRLLAAQPLPLPSARCPRRACVRRGGACRRATPGCLAAASCPAAPPRPPLATAASHRA